MRRGWLQWYIWTLVCVVTSISIATGPNHLGTRIVGLGMIAVLYGCISLGLLAKRPTEAPPVARALRAERWSCYLVVHLDLNQSPPTVLFVTTYSCSAKDLTHTGAHEARADLYKVEADSFEEALDEMRRLQPLYFPWATPYLARKR